MQRAGSSENLSSYGTPIKARPIGPKGSSNFSNARKTFAENQKVKIKNGTGIPGFSDGIIYQKNPDGTYDCQFNNGRIERKVSVSRIAVSNATTESESKSDEINNAKSMGTRPTRSGSPPIPTHSNTSSEIVSKYRMGQPVEVQRNGEERWVVARIISSRSNGNYDVQYEDKSQDQNIPPKYIRLIQNQFKKQSLRAEKQLIEEGSKIEGNYRGKGRWYPGRVTKVNRDGTFDIDYDDGERETKVDEASIRASNLEKDRFLEGDRIDLNYKGRGSWLPGVINIARLNGSYDISCDDGETEKNVSSEFIRYAIQSSHKDILLLPEVIENLRQTFRKYQTFSDTTCQKEFEEYDESPSKGTVTKKEFRNILKTIHKKSKKNTSFEEWLPDETLRVLTDCLTYNGSSNVNYDSFLAFVLDVEDNTQLSEIHSKLQKIIFKKNKVPIKEIKKMFSSSKTFSNGYVRLSEFEKILLKLSPKILTSDIALLSKKFDLEQEGTIDYNLFIYWITVGLNPDNLRSKFAHQLSLIGDKTVESILNRLSSKGNYLSRKDFVDAIASMGAIVSSCDVSKMFEILDNQENNRITIEDVLNIITKKSKSNNLQGENLTIELINSNTKKEIHTSVVDYLETSKKSLGQLLMDISEEKTGSINRRQLRRVFESIQVKLSESEEVLLFDSLEFSGEGFINYYDLLVYLMYLGLENDDIEASQALRSTILKKKIAPKEFYRSLNKQDHRGTGYVVHTVLEHVLPKLGGSSVSSSQIQDVKRFLDPNRNGIIDSSYAAAILLVCSDPLRAENKLKHSLKLMRTKGFEYNKVILAAVENSNEEVNLSKEEFISILSSFSIPVLKCELELIAEKHHKRGLINMKKLLDHLENEDTLASTLRQSTDKLLSFAKGSGNSFGRDLFKKISKIRANRDKNEEFRKLIIEKDKELTGRISQKDLRSVIDHKMDLKDEEMALLTENLLFTDGSHRHELDYSLLLLIMIEPLAQAPITAGILIMNKMVHGADLVGLRRLLDLLFRNCASSDSRSIGLIPYEDIAQVLKDECLDVDEKYIDELIKSFQDSESDCIFYPEMIAFLGSCSIENVMKRIRFLDLIRMKQGYILKDFLKKYASKSMNKLDQAKLSEQLESLGIFFPDTAIAVIFSHYSIGQRKILDVNSFIEALEGADSMGRKSTSGRKQVAGFQAKKDMCEIAEEILRDYDKKVIHCLQLAFDLFAKETNEVPASELERVLRSVGQLIDYYELGELLVKIDPRNTGFLEFDEFMGAVVPFLQNKYSKIGEISVYKLKELFFKFDESGDGMLQPYELKHVLRLCASNATQEEVEALLEFLDLDGDGDITWEEFSRIFSVVHNDNEMSLLSFEVRSALRKIQYSSLPDPEELLTMFIGLPQTYRVSALSDLENFSSTIKTRNCLQNVACSNPFLNDVPESSCLQFEIEMIQVNGCPSEDPIRHCDLVSRGVKFAICQTDKPPIAGEPGNPPLLLGNVTKIHATRHQKYEDKWIFNRDPEIIETDKTCFVQCSTTDFYNANISIPEMQLRTTPIDQLYLFIELNSTFKISNKFELVPGGIKKVRNKVVVEQEVELEDEISYKKKSSDFIVETRTLSDRANSKIGGFLKRNKDRDSSSIVNNASRVAKSLLKSALFGKENIIKKENIIEEDQEIDDDLVSMKNNKMFDMCCGWAMVPIASTLRSNNRKLKVTMCGGTPFASMDINDKEVKKRRGIIPMLQRFFGFHVTSELEIKLTQAFPNPKFLPPKIPTERKEDDKVWFTKLLPPNIILPISSVTVVGMYRKLLIQSVQITAVQIDRILPQTGILHHADALLSSFPRILQDEAACRVLLILWKREFPKDMSGKTYKDLAITDTSNVRSLQVFRSVVLRLWVAFSSPHSMVDKLHPFETSSECKKREMRIRSLVGIPSDGSEAAAEYANKKSISNKLVKQSQEKKKTIAVEGGGNKLLNLTLGFSSFSNRTKTTTTNNATIVGGVVVANALEHQPNAGPKPLVNNVPSIKDNNENQIIIEQPLCTPFHCKELIWTTGR